MIERLQLGAPGIYELPEVPLRALTGVRMDIAAFAGVAPRGPARVPYFLAPWAPKPALSGQTMQRTVAVPVESWTEYQRIFGGYEGPGLLPYAVASFFENGGRRALIARIVHDYAGPEPSLIARGRLGALVSASGTPIELRARNEGSWGNALSSKLELETRPLLFEAAGASTSALILPSSARLPDGTLLRLQLEGGARSLRYVSRVDAEWSPESGEKTLRVTFDIPLATAPIAAELVSGRLTTRLGDRVEVIDDVAFSSAHPRWLARVLIEESSLLFPHESDWLEADLALSAELNSFVTEPFAGGDDRYQEIVHSDFFDPLWTPGDERAADGVHAIVDQPSVSLLCTPDLYSPAPLVPQQNVITESVASGEFEPCVPIAEAVQAARTPDLDGLRLDPSADLPKIIELQRSLTALVAQLRGPIVLLDVPPGLSHKKILRWRAELGSAMFAAAYHPWLDVSVPGDQRNVLIRVPPSAIAAGIIAQRELASGVQHGPANELARGVVRAADRLSPARHDELHREAINVYLPERDGIRLTAARTLSRDPDYRQLSVRRLMTMLVRVLDRQMQWMVFEPNTRALRKDVVHVLTAYLRQLFRAQAFRGEREDQAFFVRCDETLNPPYVVDRGQLIVEIGVAPAEPIEFIVLEIVRDGDGTIRVRGE